MARTALRRMHQAHWSTVQLQRWQASGFAVTPLTLLALWSRGALLGSSIAALACSMSNSNVVQVEWLAGGPNPEMRDVQSTHVWGAATSSRMWCRGPVGRAYSGELQLTDVCSPFAWLAWVSTSAVAAVCR